jgi:phosphohistidine phosphatase
MDLFIVRHGVAVDIGEQGVLSDEERMLSAKGRSRTQEVAYGLNQLGCAPRVILTSPLVRARETAEILRDELSPDLAPTDRDELAPGRPASQMAETLLACPESTILLVGHMPDLSFLASYLLTGDEGRLDIAFKKAGVCLIRFSDRVTPGGGTLQWVLPPKPLRSFARR